MNYKYCQYNTSVLKINKELKKKLNDFLTPIPKKNKNNTENLKNKKTLALYNKSSYSINMFKYCSYNTSVLKLNKGLEKVAAEIFAFISETIYLGKSKLYIKNGRLGLPISFSKLSKKFGVSVGFCQRLLRFWIQEGLITHEYARDDFHKPTDCKLIFLTEKTRKLIREQKIAEAKKQSEKKYAIKKFSRGNNNNFYKINHSENDFKKHNDKIGAKLAKIWIRISENRKINPSTVAFLRSGFNSFVENYKNIGKEFSSEDEALHRFSEFLKHQKLFLKRFSLFNALNFKAIRSYIGKFMLAAAVCVSSYTTASSDWIEKNIAPICENKPMSKEEVAMRYEKEKEARRERKKISGFNCAMNFQRKKQTLLRQWTEEINKNNIPVLGLQLNCKKTKMHVTDNNLAEAKLKMIQEYKKVFGIEKLKA